MTISNQQARVRRFIVTALKRWSTSGFDSAQGLFEEALTFDGAPVPDLPRRGRAQARQMYVFALANLYGFDPSGEYLRLAELVSETSEAIYRHENGGWIFSAGPDGKPVNSHCFAYEQSFRIMSLAALNHASGKPTYAEMAEKNWKWIEGLRDSVHGGFQLGLPHIAGVPREQNPHMHLFEASLEATSIDKALWLSRSDEIYTLAMSRFISPDGALVEFFGEDWTPDTATGADIQPGHHFEWSWLLTRYASLKRVEVRAILTLYDNGVAWGLDADGMGVDEVRPGGLVLRGTKRLWVQCEVLKGHLARFEVTGDEIFLTRASNILDKMFDHYLIEEVGVWTDQPDEKSAATTKVAPATSFYHVIIALNEFLRITAG